MSEAKTVKSQKKNHCPVKSVSSQVELFMAVIFLQFFFPDFLFCFDKKGKMGGRHEILRQETISIQNIANAEWTFHVNATANLQTLT